MDDKSQSIRLGDTAFQYVGDIIPEQDQGGSIRGYTPQAQYAKASTATLHKHGAGPFCRFAITALKRAPAVYVITVDGTPKYVGETVDLLERFGPRGYGVIHPRNCYVGGQPTNCKVNNKIYAAACTGHRIALYVYYTPQHKEVESAIRAMIRLPWNSI